eukprot:GEMP01005265.1.p1 GENE.GEMP01005265.1~~GEMP01005265.1.p1  ORF type:complete len:997 (+),score=236.95 GEMP01005265.1:42-3032(+)
METFVEAAQAFFRSSDPKKRKDADAWLQTCQQGMDGWRIVESVLSQPDKVEPEVAYLAAQTLRTKVQLDFEQLPHDSVASLRDHLLQHCITYREHPQIRTQLTLAVADMAIHTEWADVVDNLIDRFGRDTAYFGILLDILQFLPEENVNLKLLTDSRKRYQSRDRLREESAKVLLFLDHLRDFRAARKQVLRCFLAWLQFSEFSAEQLIKFRLLMDCFDTILEGNDVGEASTDVIVEVLRMSARELEVFQPLVAHLLPYHGKLQEVFERQVHDQQQDIDLLQRLVRVFTETGECLVNQIVEQHDNQQVSGILRVLRLSMQLPPECAWIAVDFWHQLANAITVCPPTHSVPEPHHHASSSSSPPTHCAQHLYASTCSHALAVFRPIFLDVLSVALAAVKMTHPPSSIDRMDDDDDEYGRYRSALLRSVIGKGVVRVVGAYDTMEAIIQSLQNVMWTDDVLGKEAHLCILSAVASHGGAATENTNSTHRCTPNQSLLIHNVLQWVSQLIRQHNRAPEWQVLHLTALRLCGTMSEWMVRDDDLVNHTLDALSHVLLLPCTGDNSDDRDALRFLVESAGVSLMQVCYSGRKNLLPHVPQLLQLVHATFPLVSAKAHCRIIEGVALLCAKVTGDGDFEQCFGSLLLPLVRAMPHEGSPEVLAQILERLRVVMEVGVPRLRDENTGKGKIVGQAVVHTLWPMLETIIQQHGKDAAVVEKAAQLLSQCMHCVPEHCKQIVPQLTVLLDRGFEAHGHSSYLYCLEVLVDAYGEYADLATALGDIFLHLSTHCVQRQKNDDHLLALGEDFLHLCGRFLQRAPHIVLHFPVQNGDSPMVSRVLHVALMAFTCGQKELVEAGALFVEEIHKWVADPQIRLQLRHFAPELVATCFQMIINVSPGYVVTVMPSLLMAVKDKFRTEFPMWLEAGMNAVGTCASADEKRKWVHALLLDAARNDALLDKTQNGNGNGSVTAEQAFKDASDAIFDLAYRCEQVALRNRGTISR